MRVHIDFTLDIDPDAWWREYNAFGDVRADVKDLIYHMVFSHLDDLGVLS